jgi:hypothetical protein
MWRTNLSASARAMMWRVTLTTLILLLAIANSLAQRKTSYYLAVGPAMTAGSDWGNGHKIGSSVEFGLMYPVGASWDVVGAFGFERFKLDEPDVVVWGAPLPDPGYWSDVRGGSDFITSIRGGARHGFTTTTRFKPYVEGLVGLALTHQDEATGTWHYPDGSPQPPVTTTLQDDNDQVAIGFSSIVGVKTRIWTHQKLFIEAGYSFVFTPDDSFDDNPSFFPFRVGLVF